MRAQNTKYIDTKTDFGFDGIVNSNEINPRPQHHYEDITSRMELIQDVIDRTVDRNFGKEYLEDLEKLNRKYPVAYKLVHGVRVYDI